MKMSQSAGSRQCRDHNLNHNLPAKEIKNESGIKIAASSEKNFCPGKITLNKSHRESPLCSGVRDGGFTMLEVMVSITIFSMVLIAIYSSWSAILRGTQLGHAAAAEAQRGRITVNALEQSLGSTELFLANLRHYAFMADTSGEFASLSFVSHLPPSFPGSGLFGDQSVRRVTFSVEPDKSGRNQLVLFQRPVLEPPETATEPYYIVLAPSIREFKAYFWETNTHEWVEEWLWTNRLPRMVRVELALGDPKRGRIDADELISKTVYIASTAIPREAQVPANRGGNRPGTPPPGTPPVNNPGANPPRRP